MERLLSFRLVDEDGCDLQRAQSIMFPSMEIVVTLKQEIKQTCQLTRVDSSDLTVFADRAAFDKRQPLCVAESLGVRYGSPEDPLIVLVPTRSLWQRWREPRPRWKPQQERERLYDLATGQLPFVDRHLAVQQLCEFHKSVYVKAKHGDHSESLPIALIDSEVGLGKSTFGTHYIECCRNQWPAQVDDAEGFEESLCAARTLRIVVGSQDFVAAALDSNSSQTPLASALAETINTYVAHAVTEELDRQVNTPLPLYLSSPSTRSPGGLLKAIVEDLGSVFIVLDDIGQAFQYDSTFSEDSRDAHEKSRILFLEFCSSVLGHWMRIPGVYFVLMGYKPFLRCVNPETVTRISLQLFHPVGIEQIMRKVWRDDGRTQTMAQYWGLHHDGEIAAAARAVYHRTCGRPRTVIAVLRHFRTFDDFRHSNIEVDDRGTKSDSWEILYGHFLEWLPLLQEWLPSILDKVPIDLSKDWSEPSLQSCQDRRKVSFETIAEAWRMGWEGTVNQATVYVMPRILTAMVTVVHPLPVYLRTIRTHYDRLALTHATALQWSCLKRFQELFSTPCSPSTVLPHFVGPETTFGKLDCVYFPKNVLRLPKICTKTSPHYFQSIDSNTAGPEHWPQLIREIAAHLQTSPGKRLVVKSEPGSASTQTILIQRIQASKADEPYLGEGKKVDAFDTLVVGIVVTNCRTTRFGPSDLSTECDYFHTMFGGNDTANHERFGRMLNILIICATNYCDELATAFQNKRYIQQHPQGCVHEVLLMDWTTPEKRADFFGFANSPRLAELLNDLVENADSSGEENA